MTEQKHFNRTQKAGASRAPHAGLITALAFSCCASLMASDVKLTLSSATASSNDGNVPANAIDGSLSTRWSAEGDGQWIHFDLGASATVKSVRVAWYKGDTRSARFDVQVSDTGSSWSTVYSGSSSGSTTALETYDVTDWTGRYVRIVGHGNSYNDWNSITEVQAYGVLSTSSGSGSGTTSGGTTTPPPTTTATLPSDVLNLTNWKLTLPVDTSLPGSPDEITQTALDSYVNPNYFYVNGAHNGVVFTAPCGGATTSGSGYPRSELREMINNGIDRASWSTSSGTHTMEITQAITHTPVVKPHVVAGQIHDAGDDVCVFRLEGTKLFVDQNGVNGPVLTSNYKLGDIFTVKFVARNGGVECYYNGSYIYTYHVSASGCYFKAGCYTQSNTSKGDAPTAYGEVVIYKLSVTHQ